MMNSKKAGDLAAQVAPGTAASPKTSATPAGQTDGATSAQRDQLVEAINQVFALFRLNYHNQFYAAYPDNTQLNQIKRLWLESLNHFSPDVILLGAKHSIEHSEYLPTLNRMLDGCQEALLSQGLPRTRDAFLEACQKPSPKHQQSWSHPAVYLAGKDCDWFFLANNPESRTWPVYRERCESYVSQVLRGETLVLPDIESLPDPHKADTMSVDARKAALASLREDVGL